MEIAKLILEYLKVLAWPFVLLFLVLKFKVPIENILIAIGKKFTSSDKIKLGLFGQEVELSGTVTELKEEQTKLLGSDTQNPSARQRAEKLEQAIPELNNPITDLVGITLLKEVKSGLTIDDIVTDVIKSFIPKSQLTTEKTDTANLFLLSMLHNVEKILQQLIDLQLIYKQGNHFILTNDGHKLFTKVALRQKSLLKRFIAQSEDK